jgi:hypothetical protein
MRAVYYGALRFPAEGNSGYQVVFMDCPFDAVPTPQERTQLMRSILNWFLLQISLDSPAGGEVWEAGTEHDILWTVEHVAEESLFSVDSISILLSADGGGAFGDTVALGEENDSSFNWIVSPSPTDCAVIRIVAHGPHDVMNWDINDNLFSIIDTTPPDVIVDPNVQLVDEDLYLSWTEPYDFVGVSSYIVHRCTTAGLAGDSLANVAETCYTDSGIVGNVNCHYFYAVQAVDGAGNKSLQSNQVGEFDRSLIREQ